MELLYYPDAIQKPLKDHSSPGTITQRNLVVLHCTSGPTASSANWAFINSVSPHRVSAHFIIDRDGSVWQLLPISDTAWHASACNHNSIGVEHAGIPKTLLCTDEQYTASAKLLAWLCQQLNIPCDDKHVQPHSVASPQDGHILCCQGALDPEKVIQAAAELIPPLTPPTP